MLRDILVYPSPFLTRACEHREAFNKQASFHILSPGALFGKRIFNGDNFGIGE
jgi:hypothetical protein